MVGAGMGGMLVPSRSTIAFIKSETEPGSSNFIMVTLNSASGVLAIMCGAKGPNLTISTACSSSAHAIGLALGAIRTGQADVVIVAGADASIVPLTFAGFCTLRALSTNFNDSPEKASRPFSQTRDGFVMGEGAGALIVESLAHAKKRKARIYAEVTGYAATSEAYHMVIPREDGSKSRSWRWRCATLASAPRRWTHQRPRDVHRHRAVEIKAIKHLFKTRAMRIPISDEVIGRPYPRCGGCPRGHHLRDDARHRPGHPTINYDDPEPALSRAFPRRRRSGRSRWRC
jgi:3-oxoacyl-[acyl-carrier-protein] synthase II